MRTHLFTKILLGAGSAALLMQAASHAQGSVSQASSPDIPIPDLAVREDTISITTAPQGALVSLVEVSFDIDHSWPADLRIDLISGDGAVGNLDSIVSPQPPRGVGSLPRPLLHYQREVFVSAGFVGLPANQSFTIRIDDPVPSDSGHFNGWSITVYYTAITAITPATPLVRELPAPTVISIVGSNLTPATPKVTGPEGPVDGVQVLSALPTTITLSHAYGINPGVYTVSLSTPSGTLSDTFELLSPLEDPDGDGINNGFELLFCLDPLNPDRDPVEFGRAPSGDVTLTYLRKKDVVYPYSIEASADLEEWEIPTQSTNVVEDRPDSERLEVTLSETSNKQRQFVRFTGGS